MGNKQGAKVYIICCLLCKRGNKNIPIYCCKINTVQVNQRIIKLLTFEGMGREWGGKDRRNEWPEDEGA